jgi:pyruvate/2-oxoglutarate dehydrogenase complex dihydrolipoamide dehydrogenase (E3) component
VATGAIAALPDVKGLDTALASGFARNIDSALGDGPENLPDGLIVVWGAAEGVELALDLARAGRKVRLLEPAATFAPTSYIGSRTRFVMKWAEEAGLTPETGVDLDTVGAGAITVAHADGRKEDIACAVLVVSPGRVAYDPLSTKLAKAGIQVQVVGDARKPRSYGNSIHEAAYLARNI